MEVGDAKKRFLRFEYLEIIEENRNFAAIFPPKKRSKITCISLQFYISD